MEINEDTKELFNDPGFEKMLKVLATNFGGDTSLVSIYESYQRYRPVPEQVINGKKYRAGYHIVQQGPHAGTLIDIRQHGPVCKMMFDIDDQGVFLYHNYPLKNLKVEQVVNLAQRLYQRFNVNVVSEIIQNTGDRHSTIDLVDGLDEVLSQ